MHTPWVIDVQRFSIHDGPGIRTTVFFKGCPLNCQWCHNPESQRFENELMFYPERCVHCGQCASICPSPKTCLGCGLCAKECPREARRIAGRAYSPGELSELLLRDRAFYDTSAGGVTLSGGEVMAQDIDYLMALLRPLRRRGVHIAIDTCGHAPYERFERLMPYVDLFLYDIKAADPVLHRRFTGADNALIIQNAARLSAAGAKINLRVPLIPGVNDSDGEMGAIINIARGIRTHQINLLPYHDFGLDKAARLKRAPKTGAFAAPSPESIARIVDMWKRAGFESVRAGG